MMRLMVDIGLQSEPIPVGLVEWTWIQGIGFGGGWMENCDHCGVTLTDEAGLMTAPTKKACGCWCYHFYQHLCTEHTVRKVGKVKRGPLSVEPDSEVLGINEKYYPNK
jgi:hypothetical protein